MGFNGDDFKKGSWLTTLLKKLERHPGVLEMLLDYLNTSPENFAHQYQVTVEEVNRWTKLPMENLPPKLIFFCFEMISRIIKEQCEDGIRFLNFNSFSLLILMEMSSDDSFRLRECSLEVIVNELFYRDDPDDQMSLNMVLAVIQNFPSIMLRSVMLLYGLNDAAAARSCRVSEHVLKGWLTPEFLENHRRMPLKKLLTFLANPSKAGPSSQFFEILAKNPSKKELVAFCLLLDPPEQSVLEIILANSGGGYKFQDVRFIYLFGVWCTTVIKHGIADGRGFSSELIAKAEKVRALFSSSESFRMGVEYSTRVMCSTRP